MNRKLFDQLKADVSFSSQEPAFCVGLRFAMTVVKYKFILCNRIVANRIEYFFKA